jgi:hypothetical protein
VPKREATRDRFLVVAADSAEVKAEPAFLTGALHGG